MRNNYFPLTLVTQRNTTPFLEYLDFIEQCAQFGITALQLREKASDYDVKRTLGEAIKAVLKPYHIPLIINDDVELACDLDADGVHLGQSDGSPLLARSRLGPDKIIGLSINSLENLQSANVLPIDYVGVGSIFKTRNKDNVATFWGINGLADLSRQSSLPIIAIGGITENNVESVIHAGAHGVAVIGALHETTCLEETIKKLLNLNSAVES